MSAPLLQGRDHDDRTRRLTRLIQTLHQALIPVDMDLLVQLQRRAARQLPPHLVALAGSCRTPQ